MLDTNPFENGGATIVPPQEIDQSTVSGESNGFDHLPMDAASSIPIDAPARENKAYRTDFWVDMHLPENDHKIRDFVADFAMDAGGDTWQLDAIMMLCEAFKMAAEDDKTCVEDLAFDFQRECFKWTVAFETAGRAYLNYLKQGVRDYRDEHSTWEHDKILMAMSGYFAQEPARHKEWEAQWDREVEERANAEKERKEAEKAAKPTRDRRARERALTRALDDEKTFEQCLKEGADDDLFDWIELACDIQRIMSNPKMPVKLWNRINDEITDIESASGTISIPVGNLINLARGLRQEHQLCQPDTEQEQTGTDEAQLSQAAA